MCFEFIFSSIIVAYQNNDTFAEAVLAGRAMASDYGSPGTGFDLSAEEESSVAAVEVSCHGQNNLFRRLYTVDGKSVANVMTAIVSVDKGRVHGVTWDYGTSVSACWFCGGPGDNRCQHNAYSSSHANVTMVPISTYDSVTYGLDCMQPVRSTCNDPRNCDLQIYVVFSGTDKDGRYMKSASRRLSRFASYSIGSIYAAAYTTSSTIAKDAKTIVG